MEVVSGKHGPLEDYNISKLGGGKLKAGPASCDMLLCVNNILASRQVKDDFFDTLQQAIAGVSSNEMFVLLGDFNAHVGSRSGGDSEWWYVIGLRGYGLLNEAGRELSFHQWNCSM